MKVTAVFFLFFTRIFAAFGCSEKSRNIRSEELLGNSEKIVLLHSTKQGITDLLKIGKIHARNE